MSWACLLPTRDVWANGDSVTESSTVSHCWWNKGPFCLMCHLFLIDSIKHCFLITGRILPGSLMKIALPPRPSGSTLRELFTVPAHFSWTSRVGHNAPEICIRLYTHITRVLSPPLASQKTWSGTYHRLRPQFHKLQGLNLNTTAWKTPVWGFKKMQETKTQAKIFKPWSLHDFNWNYVEYF